jgi:hypothetical protein
LVREGDFTDKTTATRPELESKQIDVIAAISEEIWVTTLEAANSEVSDYD